MNYAAVKSAQWNGQNSEMVRVECTQTLQLPSFRFSGAPASAAVEMRDRLIAAFSSCGLRLPGKRIIVGFTPRLKPPYDAFDLPVALSVLAAANVIPRKNLENTMFLGGLGLDGSLVDLPGMGALAAEFSSGVAVPWASSILLESEQLMNGGGFKNLAEVISFFRAGPNRGKKMEKLQVETESLQEKVMVEDIVGQLKAKRLLTIAAAGGHFGIFSGPHGWGKTLLARALWGLLPDLTESERRDLRRIYASTGSAFPNHPPFRAVDSSFSTRTILGAHQRAGEVALAHRGVLFLDELMEWPRTRLESLRIPLEAKTFRLIVVAATNSCPCGRAGSSVLLCRCTDYERERYQRRISGAFLDRFDLGAEVVDQNLESENGNSPTSEALREIVARARERMLKRQGSFNGELKGEEGFTVFPWTKSARRLAKEIFRTRGLTRRGYAALARVSLTICDLREGQVLTEKDVYEAAHFHPQSLFTPRLPPTLL